MKLFSLTVGRLPSAAPEAALLLGLPRDGGSAAGSKRPCSTMMVLGEGAREDVWMELLQQDAILAGGYSVFTLPCLATLNGSEQLGGKFTTPTPVKDTSAPPSGPATTLPHVLGSLQLLRKRTGCSVIVYFSSTQDDLKKFCRVAAATPIIGTGSRLVLVSHLQEVPALGALKGCWAFEEWGAPLLLMGEEEQSSMWMHRQYSPSGPVTQRVTLPPVDSQSEGSPQGAFPQPFSSFHGAVLNITALEYPPFWSVRLQTKYSGRGNYDVNGDSSGRAGDNVSVEGPDSEHIGGADGELLKMVAKALNFSFRIIHTSSWDEAASLVSAHKSMLTSVEHYVYPERLQMHDFTDVYHVSTMAFSLAVPRIRHGWTSLLRPFQGSLWLSILATIVAVPLPLLLISRLSRPRSELDSRRGGSFEAGHNQTLSSGAANNISEFFCSFFLLLHPLLNQGLQSRPSSALAERLVLGAWLVFAFILSTAFTTTLIASLTLPRLPSRSETLPQLVAAGNRLTMPPYGDTLKGFLSSSSLPEFRQLGQRIDIVPSIEEGLREASEGRSAQLEDRMYLSYVIADQFTSASGASALYVAREGLFPGYLAWPVPFAAPYKHALSRVMRTAVEAGLYQKWYEDVLQSLGRQKRHHNEAESANDLSGNSWEAGNATQADRVADGPVALNFRHLLSAVAVLLIGWTGALLSFACERRMAARQPVHLK